MRTRAAAAVLVAVALVGCGGDGDDGDRAAAPASTTTTAPSEPAPVTTTPVAGRVEHRFELPGGPDWLATDGEAVWVKRDDGTVDRVDPATNEVRSLKVAGPGERCQGIGAGPGGGVWACAGRGIVRVAPDASSVLATVEVQKVTDQGHIGVGFGHAWVLSGDGSTLVGVSVETNEPAVEIDLGARCTDVATGPNTIWAVCAPDDVVLEVDPVAEAVVVRVEGLDQPSRAVETPGGVWVAAKGVVARIDTDENVVAETIPTSPGAVDGLAHEGGRLWLRSGPRFLRVVDTASASVVEELGAPEPSGGDVLVAFGSVWATAYDDAVLYRVRMRP